MVYNCTTAQELLESVPASIFAMVGSLRKDVECTFGILKGRCRILNTGICLHNTEIVDHIWISIGLRRLYAKRRGKTDNSFDFGKK